MRDVIVIGAGITGLSAARDLVAAGLDVMVLERAAVVGGKAISENIAGYLMEHGPTTLNAAMPEAEELTRALGLEAARVDLGRGVKKRYLFDQGRLCGISTHPAGFILSPYLPLAARLSVLAEGLRPARRDGADETVHDFTSRRFGRGFADLVMSPMVGGIFMGDARELSVGAVFPKLLAFEQQHGSVMRGMFHARKKGDPGRRLFSWRTGVATLPHSLARALGKRVKTGVAVTRLQRLERGITVKTSVGSETARAVLLSVQPHVAAQLIAPVDPAGASAAAAIPAPAAAVVFAGYRRRDVAHPLDGLGYLSTAGSGAISGVQFASTMFENRAPDGHVAIAAYVGGARGQALAKGPAHELAALVHEELANTLGIGAPPVLRRVRQWSLGLPQYRLGHAALCATLESSSTRAPGLYLAGNYLRGVSVGHCIASGQGAAMRICRDLGVKRCATTAVPATSTSV